MAVEFGTQQFGRTYRLELGRPISLEYRETPAGGQLVSPEVEVSEFVTSYFNQVDPSTSTRNTVTGQSGNQLSLYKVDFGLKAKTNEELFGRVITENHIEFQIDKTETSSINESFIDIYNLSDETVQYINKLAGKGAICKLDAGYGDDLAPIMLANLEGMEDNFEGTDRVTRLTFSEGGKIVVDCMFSNTYARGTQIDDIVSDMINGLGMSKGQVDNTGGVTTRPLFFWGKTWDQLVAFGKNHGYKASIQDLSVNFILSDKDESTRIENKNRAAKLAPDISPESGLIGAPTLTFDSGGKSGKNTNTTPVKTYLEAADGVKVKTLLNPTYRVGQVFKLTSRGVNGVFKITELTHKGSYEGNEWYSEIVADRVEGAS